jgi:hypothetical protein
LSAEFSTTSVNDLPCETYQAAKQACLKMIEEQSLGVSYILCPFMESQVRAKVRGALVWGIIATPF